MNKELKTLIIAIKEEKIFLKKTKETISKSEKKLDKLMKKLSILEKSHLDEKKKAKLQSYQLEKATHETILSECIVRKDASLAKLDELLEKRVDLDEIHLTNLLLDPHEI